MNLSKEEENQMRKTIEALEEEEKQFVLEGDTAGTSCDWADDLAVNAPNYRVMYKLGIR